MLKRVRIDYTIYSPDYSGDRKSRIDQCWDFPTIAGARKKAKELGVGSLVIRNFNRSWPSDWWQTRFCWVWDGFAFKKVYPVDEKKWRVDPSAWNRASLQGRFRRGRR